MKKPFTLHEHRGFAERLRDARSVAVHLLVAASARYSGKSRLARAARRFLDALAELRAVLDDQLYRDRLDEDPPDLYYDRNEKDVP